MMSENAHIHTGAAAAASTAASTVVSTAAGQAASALAGTVSEVGLSTALASAGIESLITRLQAFTLSGKVWLWQHPFVFLGFCFLVRIVSLHSDCFCVEST